MRRRWTLYGSSERVVLTQTEPRQVVTRVEPAFELGEGERVEVTPAISPETLEAATDALEQALKAAQGISGNGPFPRWESALAELRELSSAYAIKR